MINITTYYLSIIIAYLFGILVSSVVRNWDDEIGSQYRGPKYYLSLLLSGWFLVPIYLLIITISAFFREVWGCFQILIEKIKGTKNDK